MQMFTIEFSHPLDKIPFPALLGENVKKYGTGKAHVDLVSPMSINFVYRMN